MKFLITIDVEEDNWGTFNPTGHTLENIKRIPKLQSLFDEFEVTPTYLVTYPVATDPMAVGMFLTYLKQGRCEIGMHCHPWNTPPFDDIGGFQKSHSMLCNLPAELQHKKLMTLHETISRNFGCAPVSFRAGRWALGLSAVQSLCRLGYRVESSVTPFMNWNSSYGPDFSNFGPEPFRFAPPGGVPGDPERSLLQVPASIGFLQKNFQLCQRLRTALENPLGRKCRSIGILDRLALVNKVWLSPELAGTHSMIALGRRMDSNNYPCINMTFHSTSLLAGLSPFVSTSQDEQVFLEKIRIFLIAARKSGWKSMTLAQFESVYDGLPESDSAAQLNGKKRASQQRQAEHMCALFQRQGAAWV